MKLIYIYGPPATGKLTVANELSKLVGINVFHNHLTFDLAKNIMDFNSENFFKLLEKLRLNCFEYASKQDIKGLIYTSCYSYPQDNSYVKKIIKRVEKYGGEILFVHLYSDKEILEKRVLEYSRKKYGKVKTIKGLRQSLENWDYFTLIPFVKSLKIDNSEISAKEVAKQIKEYFKL